MITQKYREGDTWKNEEMSRKIIKRDKFDIWYEEENSAHKCSIDSFGGHVRKYRLTLKK